MAGLQFANLGNTASMNLLDESSNFKDPKLLAVKPENGKNNEYEMYLRFLPNLGENARANIYKKDFVRISTGSKNGESIIFDMPRTSGYTSIFKSLSFLMSDLKKDKANEEFCNLINKEYFSTYSYYYAYVYVEGDVNTPENVGHIKVFRFPYSIYKLIEKTKEGTQMKSGMDPFDLLKNPRFYFRVGKQFGFANYDDCKFEDVTPFMYYTLDANNQQQLMQVTQEEINYMIQGSETPLSKFLTEEMNGLEKYDYEEPSKDSLIRGINIMKQFIFKYQSLYTELMNKSNDEEMKKLLAMPTAQIITPNPTVAAPQAAEPVTAGQPTMFTAPAAPQAQPQTLQAAQFTVPQPKSAPGFVPTDNKFQAPQQPASNAGDEDVNNRYEQYLKNLK